MLLLVSGGGIWVFPLRKIKTNYLCVCAFDSRLAWKNKLDIQMQSTQWYDANAAQHAFTFSTSSV